MKHQAHLSTGLLLKSYTMEAINLILLDLDIWIPVLKCLENIILMIKNISCFVNGSRLNSVHGNICFHFLFILMAKVWNASLSFCIFCLLMNFKV